jgi:hypothetical protein
MEGFFNGYGSLLFLAGIIGFMVWSHSRGGGCGMHGHGGHGHGDNRESDNEHGGASEGSEASDEKVTSEGKSCH